MIFSCLPPSVSFAASDGPPRLTVTTTSTTAIATASTYGSTARSGWSACPEIPSSWDLPWESVIPGLDPCALPLSPSDLRMSAA